MPKRNTPVKLGNKATKVSDNRDGFVLRESNPCPDSPRSQSCQSVTFLDPKVLADSLIEALKDDRLIRSIQDTICAGLLRKLEDKDEEIKELKSRVETLEDCIDKQEQYTRRNYVRIFVEDEEKKGESTDEIVINTAKKMGVDLKLNDINRSHRVGRSGNKPRPIICSFVSQFSQL